MNLENLNLVELNAQQVKETDGGFWGELGTALAGAAFYLSGGAQVAYVAGAFGLGAYNGYHSH